MNVETVVDLYGIWQRWAGDEAHLLYQFGSGEVSYGQAWLRVDSENNYTNGRILMTFKTDGTDWQCVTIRYTKTT